MRIKLIAVLLLLLTTALSVTYGDTLMPVNVNSFSDENILIQFHVDGLKIQFCVTLKYYGFFGILYGSQMSNGDFTIVELATGGIVAITDSHSTSGHIAPTADTTQNINLIGYETDTLAYVKVKFSRLLNTGDSQDTVLLENQLFAYAYAYSSTSPTLVYHGTKKKIFSGILSNSATLEQHAAIIDKIIHGVILTLAWCLIADIAIYFKFAFWHPARLLIHTLLMTLAIAMTICSVVYIFVREKPNFDKEDDEDKAHYTVGLSVLTWMILQMLQGILARVLIAKPETLPITIINLRRFHRWSGYVLVLFCKTNCILGWYIVKLKIGLFVVTADIALTFFLYGLFRWNTWGRMTSEVTKSAEVVVTKHTPLLKDLMKKPYNWKEVQVYKFILLDNRVYMLPFMAFHPGGLNIIEFVNGREVDRFLYGLCSLELYPHLQPNEHPKQSLQLLSSPVLQLERNPLVQLTETSFVVGQMQPLTQDLSIFYFQPIAGIVLFRKMENLWHLGQYFSLYAFEKTRLYSIALSLRKENLFLYESIIKFLVPQQRRLKIISKSISYLNQKYVDDSLMDLGSQARLKYPEGTLPLLIKRYNEPNAFTRQLYANLATKLQIDGLKGRGMCLEAIPDGDIVIIAANSGLYRFVDFIDLIFKATVSIPHHIIIPPHEMKVAKSMIKRHSFTIVLSTNTVQDLVMPDALNLISAANSPRARVIVQVQEPFSSDAFLSSNLCASSKSLGLGTIEKIVTPLKNLQMVYVCVPPIKCKDLVVKLWACKIDADKIFFM